MVDPTPDAVSSTQERSLLRRLVLYTIAFFGVLVLLWLCANVYFHFSARSQDQMIGEIEKRVDERFERYSGTAGVTELEVLSKLYQQAQGEDFVRVLLNVPAYGNDDYEDALKQADVKEALRKYKAFAQENPAVELDDDWRFEPGLVNSLEAQKRFVGANYWLNLQAILAMMEMTTQVSQGSERFMRVQNHLTYFPEHEGLNYTFHRLRWTNSLNFWLRRALHKADFKESTLLDLERFYAKPTPLPKDFLRTGLENQYFLDKEFVGDLMSQATGGAEILVNLFPSAPDWFLRREFLVFLDFYEEFGDYSKKISIEKPFNRQLEKGTWFSDVRNYTQDVGNGHYVAKEYVNNWRVTRVCLQLEIYSQKVGKYPDSLTELKSLGYEPMLDLFTGEPFVYEADGNGSFRITSKSTWHPKNAWTYHNFHEHENH